MVKIQSSEITPEHVYINRRQFMRLGALAVGAAALAACARKPIQFEEQSSNSAGASAGATAANPPVDGAARDELGDPANSYEDITHYNNYYEFATDKEAVAR